MLGGGSIGFAIWPSGAAKGAAGAHEFREGDRARYACLWVLYAVFIVYTDIDLCLRGFYAADHASVDARLLAVDCTAQLCRLGANETLGVSLAVCRATAAACGQALYERIGNLAQTKPLLPLPMTNILSGGMHAG